MIARPLSGHHISRWSDRIWGAWRSSAPSQDTAIADFPGFRLECPESASHRLKADCRLPTHFLSLLREMTMPES